MTIREFQEKYHAYATDDEQEARLLALKLRVTDENGKVEPIHAVKLGGRWALMVETAVKEIKRLGII